MFLRVLAFPLACTLVLAGDPAPRALYARADAHYREGRYDSAIAELTRLRARLLSKDPDGIELARVEALIGTCHFRLALHADAARWFESAIARSAAPREILRLRIQLAAARLELGQVDRAEIDLCNVLRRADNEPLLYSNSVRGLAAADAARSRVRSALSLLQISARHLAEIKRGDPALPEAMHTIAESLVAVGRVQLSLESFESAEQSFGRALLLLETIDAPRPSRRSVAAWLAFALTSMDEFASAERVLGRYGRDSADAQDEGAALVRLSRAALQAARGQLRRAKQSLAAVTKNVQRHVQVSVRYHLVRARVHTAQGRVADARADFRETIQCLADEDGIAASAVRLEWAAMEAQLGDINKAIVLAHEAARARLTLLGGRDSATKRAADRLARYSSRSKPEAGAEVLAGVRRGDRMEAGWKERDDHVTRLLGRAAEAVKRNELSQAHEYLRDAIELRPADDEVLTLKATVLGRLGKTDQAIGCALRIVRHNDPSTKHHGLLAALYAKKGEWGSVIVHATRAILLDDTAQQPLLLLAHARSARAEWTLAESAAQDYLRYEPKSNSAWSILGEALA